MRTSFTSPGTRVWLALVFGLLMTATPTSARAQSTGADIQCGGRVNTFWSAMNETLGFMTSLGFPGSDVAKPFIYVSKFAQALECQSSNGPTFDDVARIVDDAIKDNLQDQLNTTVTTLNERLQWQSSTVASEADLLYCANELAQIIDQCRNNVGYQCAPVAATAGLLQLACYRDLLEKPNNYDQIHRYYVEYMNTQEELRKTLTFFEEDMDAYLLGEQDETGHWIREGRLHIGIGSTSSARWYSYFTTLPMDGQPAYRWESRTISRYANDGDYQKTVNELKALAIAEREQYLEYARREIFPADYQSLKSQLTETPEIGSILMQLNLAFGKSVDAHPAVVDGNVFGAPAVSLTDWRVDLGEVRGVSVVAIHKAEGAGYTVDVLDQDGQTVFTQNIGQSDRDVDYAFFRNPFDPAQGNRGSMARGKFVRLRSTGGPISVREVFVYGGDHAHRMMTRSTPQSTAFAWEGSPPGPIPSNVSSLAVDGDRSTAIEVRGSSSNDPVDLRICLPGERSVGRVVADLGLPSGMGYILSGQPMVDLIDDDGNTIRSLALASMGHGVYEARIDDATYPLVQEVVVHGQGVLRLASLQVFGPAD